MILVRDRHELEVNPNLELLETFGMSLKGDCYDIYKEFHYTFLPNLVLTKNFLKTISLLIRHEKVTKLD
jgi:hypothetical protein